jgi:anthranilate synthase
MEIWCEKTIVNFSHKDALINRLSKEKGVYLCSSFEYPGRYSRWDIGFVNPPLELRTFGLKFEIRSLNDRGLILLNFIDKLIAKTNFTERMENKDGLITGFIIESNDVFPEEQRSRQPSVFSLIREINKGFYSKDESFLGLYGSFGYDLIFQFEKVDLKRKRDDKQPDMVLFIPDEIFLIDHRKDECYTLSYDFGFGGKKSTGLERTTQKYNLLNRENSELTQYVKGKYASLVDVAKDYFKRGDLFEVVPSHTFQKECSILPSDLFKNLTKINPSPYGFLINLGEEALIGASPEMYVRVEGKRVETCPISGTIKRGETPLEDAKQIKILLDSKKDESELTMCTDVDRNDKSRICIPGSVKVIGRRQIEMYSHLIHTVDHVEGYLRDEFDSLDAFMTHMWAVTVTGAPKKWAIEWIEKHEDSNRLWYGGAVGVLGFNGDINTGLTLRTIRLKKGVASIRVGATLLYDSVPEDEEEETIVKAAALNRVLDFNYRSDANGIDKKTYEIEAAEEEKTGRIKVLLVDHEDSFVHTLSSYFRQAGVKVETLRHKVAIESLEKNNYDMVVLSPGPGRPNDFNLNQTIKLAIDKGIPIFGVCLGLQGIIEYFGGKLGTLDIPYHGKPSKAMLDITSPLFKGLDKEINIGRYHSLYAIEVPEEINVIARTEDDIVMAIEHKEMKIYAVQFHPESIMTFEKGNGYTIIRNVIDLLGDEKDEG